MNFLVGAGLLLMTAPQTSVDDRIAQFVKGDAAAREALIKFGAAAIQPLQGARDKAPEKIDELVFEIKKAVAYPKETKAPASLEAKKSIEVKGAKFRDAVAHLQETCGVPLVCDRFEPADLKSNEVSVVSTDAPVRAALDLICRQTGLDYGFFHNVVVVGKPDRLWPSGKSSAAFGPPAVERQHRTPDDDKTLDHLRKMKINLDFQNADVRVVSEYMKEISGIPFEVDDPDHKPIPIYRVKDLSAFDAMALAAQICNLDFMIKERKVVVGTRDAIQKAITKGSK